MNRLAVRTLAPLALALIGSSCLFAGHVNDGPRAHTENRTGKTAVQPKSKGSRAVRKESALTIPPSAKVVALIPQDSGLLEYNFETNSAVVVHGFPMLDCTVKGMSENGDIFLVLEGHADGRGTKAHNLKLSQARADALMAYLHANGIPSERMRAIGMGALPMGSREHNFEARMVRIFPHKGSFDGTVLPRVPVTDCHGLGDSQPPITRMERVVEKAPEIDYDRIDRALAKRLAAMPQPTPCPPPPIAATPSDGGDFRLTIAAGRSNDTLDPSLYALTGDYLRPAGSQAHTRPKNSSEGHSTLADADGRDLIQMGFQVEGSSYRRKADVYGIYTLRNGTPVTFSAIGTYGWDSGVPIHCTPPAERTIVRGGARVGLDEGAWGVGAMYLTPISQQSSGADVLTPTPTEPANLLVLDGRIRINQLGFNGSITHLGQPIQNTIDYPSSSRIGWSIQCIYRLQDFLSQRASVVAGVESAPLYQLYGSNPEVRTVIGIRVGGNHSSDDWINMPSLRQGIRF